MIFFSLFSLSLFFFLVSHFVRLFYFHHTTYSYFVECTLCVLVALQIRMNRKTNTMAEKASNEEFLHFMELMLNECKRWCATCNYNMACHQQIESKHSKQFQHKIVYFSGILCLSIHTIYIVYHRYYIAPRSTGDLVPKKNKNLQTNAN